MTERKCICGVSLEGYHFNQKRCPSCAKAARQDNDRRSKNIVLAKDALECPVCHERFNTITAGHYKKHGFSSAKEFKKTFGLKTLKAPSISADQSKFMTQYSPTKGKKRTDDEKNKMSRNRTGKGIGVAGKYERTPEIRAKISKGVADFQLNYPEWNCNKFFKGCWIYSDKVGREVWVRSSWEKRVVQILDRYDEVEEIQVEPFRIPYMFEGSVRQYIPDFLVVFEGNVREVWEVKPKEFKMSPKNQAKWEALNVYTDKHKMHSRFVTLEDIENMEYKTQRAELLNCMTVI